MNHNIIGLFPQPLTKIKIDVSGIGKFFDQNVRDDVKGYNNTKVSSDQGLKHFHNDDNVFEIYSELKPLGETILNAANYTYQTILNHDTTLRFTNAWFNECAIGSEQFLHNHCNSIVSGTLYLRTDENTCIHFISPFRNSEFSPSIVDIPNMKRNNNFGYTFHHDIVTLSVFTGDCLFWGSHMKHGYPPNKTPGRLSLSFNLIPTTFNSTYKI